MRVYVDTNVFMDFLGNRYSSAYEFFVKTVSCTYNILISDVVIEELKYQKVDTDTIMKILSHKTEVFLAIPQDKIRAKSLHTHYNDALHICIAERAKADMIITRNKKDFIDTDICVKSTDDL